MLLHLFCREKGGEASQAPACGSTPSTMLENGPIKVPTERAVFSFTCPKEAAPASRTIAHAFVKLPARPMVDSQNMAMGQNPVPPVNIPIPTKIDHGTIGFDPVPHQTHQ